MPRLLTLFAALLLFLLPSCMYWDIGGNIRALAEQHVGVDVGRQYLCGDDVVVPECRYHKSPWVACILYPHWHDPKSYTYGAEFTGRYRIYERLNRYNCDGDRSAYPLPVGELRNVEGHMLIAIDAASGAPLPGGAMHTMDMPTIHCPIGWGAVQDAEGRDVVERSSWYTVAAIAAAPFDYVIDPVLTVVTSPMAWLYLVGEIIVFMVS